MSESQPVLVVGATGYVGGQVVDELLARNRPVRALVRPGTAAGRLKAKGVEVARGDLLDPASLETAMTGADAVVTTAAGYTRRLPNADEVDTVGQANLGTAAARAGVRRFVLTSILTCDQTPEVPHFWHKKLAEDHLEAVGVPFVALRPGAFLDNFTRYGADPFATGRLIPTGLPDAVMTFVLTADLARYLAEAVDAPGVDGERIDIGWTRPVSAAEVAEIASRLLGRRIEVSTPADLPRSAGDRGGPSWTMTADMRAMTDWFSSGRYVADSTRQGQVFGAVPTPEEAITRFLVGLGHEVRG
ncbi:SDR family oxidoreductase [Raineyella sp. W15-4]|uniref:SDR family oxidoreductase n=1 Tax=Raineyella sp. W15-4 TaxID=3081651 RepID=UPI002954E457|nr:SDR family oxidoreductase [Raineyella sp. W15-4]WOQ15789.1 SDR family oxidoreductase [Raineyella sp. W15-4]